MKTLESQFNYIEQITMEIQNHALHINEYKNNGVDSIPIGKYLDLLDSVITYVKNIENDVNENELKIKNQSEQIDNLLDYLSKNK